MMNIFALSLHPDIAFVGNGAERVCAIEAAEGVRADKWHFMRRIAA